MSFSRIQQIHQHLTQNPSLKTYKITTLEDIFELFQAHFIRSLLENLHPQVIFEIETVPKTGESHEKFIKTIKTQEIFYFEGQLKSKLKNPLEGVYWISNNNQTEKADSPMPGNEPFISGPYPGMYSSKPWTIRQYAGFSTAKASNEFYHANLKKGQMGLSVAFDLPTHRGYDSDHPNVSGDVGMSGVAIDSIEDMRVLFDKIPLDKMSVSMTMNGAVLPIMAMYLVVAKEQGVSWDQLNGTIQNDILKEFMVRNTFIYPPAPSMRIVGDIIAFCAKNVPKFNPISISGYHIQEAGANAALELGLTLANALEYVRLGLNCGLKVDEFAPRLSFFFGIGMDYFTEVAKLRAARVLWSRLMKKYFDPKDKKSLLLRVHCQTSGWSLCAKDIYNNLARTMLEAMAAVHGGTQSLHTNAYDEALALPCEESAKWALNTQIYLQKSTDYCHKEFIDPWYGSTEVEKLTEELIDSATKIIEEIEAAGGMVKSIESFIPQTKIEQSAIITQAKIDSGEQKIIGVNYLNQLQENSSTQSSTEELLSLDPQKNKDEQIHKLKSLRANRKNENVQHALNEIKVACKNPAMNLLEYTIKAIEAKATLGEISLAIEQVYQRYEKHSHQINGIYLKQFTSKNDSSISLKIDQKIQLCLARYGRRPRILLAKMGQDGHDRGIKILASAFSDFGFDVDLGGLFSTPSQVVKSAIENDVQIIGISSLAGGHKQLIPELMQELQHKKAQDIIVVLGGIIPPKDYHAMTALGVKAIFGPNSCIPDCIITLLDILLTNEKHHG